MTTSSIHPKNGKGKSQLNKNGQKVMDFLRAQKGGWDMGVSNMAQIIGIDRRTCSRTLDWLDANGYIMRNERHIFADPPPTPPPDESDLSDGHLAPPPTGECDSVPPSSETRAEGQDSRSVSERSVSDAADAAPPARPPARLHDVETAYGPLSQLPDVIPPNAVKRDENGIIIPPGYAPYPTERVPFKRHPRKFAVGIHPSSERELADLEYKINYLRESGITPSLQEVIDKSLLHRNHVRDEAGNLVYVSPDPENEEYVEVPDWPTLKEIDDD